MLLFRATSFSTLIMLGVQSIYIPWSIRDWYLEVKVRARDRQYSSCLLILWTKVTKILRWLTWMFHVMHNTCTMHGRDIKTQYIGSTSILLFRKDWNSIRLDRMLSSFKKHFSYCIPKVVRMKPGEVLYEKAFMSPRPPPKISLKHEWKRQLGSDHAQRAEAGQLSRSFQSNHLWIQFVRDRGDLISHMTWLVCKMKEKRPVLRRSMLILFAKNLVLQSERCDLLRDPFRENPFMRRV